MSLSLLAGFGEGFGRAFGAQKDRKEREQIAARQDKLIEALGAVPVAPVPQGGGGIGGGGDVVAATMPTSTSAAYVRDGLIKRGMPAHIADGWALNFQDESAFNTSAVGDNGNAFGLAQWNGPRMKALKAFASERGVDPSNPDLQMDYLMHELNGAEAGAWRKIQAATTPGDAAVAIVNYFERPAEVHRATREKKYRAYGAGPSQSEAAPTAAKRNALRAEWEGFKHVPDQDLDAAIAAFESKGGTLTPRPMGARPPGGPQ